MKSKSLITLAAMLILPLALVSCEKKEETPTTPPTPENNSEETGLSKMGESMKDAAKDVEKDMKETAKEVKESVKGAASEMEKTAENMVGQMVDSFSAVDHTGKSIKLSDYQDKIVVLEWINPQCPYVERHYKADTMEKLAREYKDKGVVWLAVNSTNFQNASFNSDWHDKQNLPYPILVDQSGTLGNLFDAKTTPHMFIINKDGKLVYEGAIDDDPRGNKGDAATNYVKQALDELLAGKKVSVNETKPYGCSVKYPN